MSNIKVCNFDRFELFGLIKEAVEGCVVDGVDIFEHRYNCNVPIKDVSSVLRLGFLPKTKRYRVLENRELTEEEIELFTSDRCVSGLNGVSVSGMDVDFSKMYRDECWYNPARGVLANIVISNDVKAAQVTDHYYNEFVVYGGIEPKHFQAVDVRILRLLEYYRREKDDVVIDAMLEQYSSLKEIASTMGNLVMNIPLRESSKWVATEIMDGSYVQEVVEDMTGIVTLDVDKVAQLPKITIKR